MTPNVEEARVPAFARGVRLRHDAARDAWIVLGPERMFTPDEHALAVLKLVDGHRSIGAVIDELARLFNAPREVIADDVVEMLNDLAGKGAVTL